MSNGTLSALSAIAASFSAIAASAAVVVTLLAGLRNKRTDVLIECHRRFDSLMVDKVGILQQLASPPTQAELFRISAWAQRFWSLQFDQYEWWQHGHVDRETYCYWMLSRHREFELAKGGSTFEALACVSGWQEVQARWPTPDPENPLSRRTDFVTFITKIQNETPEGVQALVWKYNPTGLRYLGMR
ncbi:MAG: hypothetical protein ABSC95_08280 [Acetobacteraceae bacterium]|jgi:hypothetical protein